MLDLRRWCITVKGNLIGFERSRVYISGKPYLDRWIVYVFFGTLRLHKFFRGDDDRAPHDHPWNFWTFPLTGYWELTKGSLRYVKAWRLHRRAASFRHIVLGTYLIYPARETDSRGATIEDFKGHTRTPFYTIVVTGNRVRGWGFWPATNLVYPDGFGSLLPLEKFVPWREWK